MAEYYYRFESGKESRQPAHIAITVLGESLENALVKANKFLADQSAVEIYPDPLESEYADSVEGFKVFFTGGLIASDLTDTDDPKHSS